MFKWEERKGWDVLLAAYLEEFATATAGGGATSGGNGGADWTTRDRPVALYLLTQPFHSDSDFTGKMHTWAAESLGMLGARYSGSNIKDGSISMVVPAWHPGHAAMHLISQYVKFDAAYTRCVCGGQVGPSGRSSPWCTSSAASSLTMNYGASTKPQTPSCCRPGVPESLSPALWQLPRLAKLSSRDLLPSNRLPSGKAAVYVVVSAAMRTKWRWAGVLRAGARDGAGRTPRR